ncbi:MAG TPA: DUF6265 family protein [Thermoanaerobaculia bacterium]
MTTTSRRAAALLLLAAAALPAGAAEPYTLADLQWMAGRWAATVDGMAGEETWHAPLGETMTGTFALVREGQPVFYEMMAIEVDRTGPVLLLRQFGAGLADARPDVLRFPLVRLEVGDDVREAAFEGPDGEGSARLTYRRKKDEMTVVLDKTKSGKSESRTFEFRLRRD